jgi:hypothetical protein
MKVKTRIITLLAVLAILGTLLAVAVVPASAADGGGSISISTPTGPVGTPVTVTASAFLPNVALYAYWDNVTLMATIPTSVITDDSYGDATFGITVPAAYRGNHTIKVTDGISSDYATFAVVPKVTITSPTTKRGPVGSSVTAQGTGFAASVGGYLYIGNDTANPPAYSLILAAVGSTDLTGSFTVSAVIPPLTSGSHTVWGKDLGGGVGGNSTANPDTFTVTPSIAVSPLSGLAGSTVTISGNGWTPGTVGLTFASGLWTTVTAKSNGQIAESYATPPGALVGVNQIVATQGTFTATTTFTVVNRALILTPSSGPRGTQVLLTGANMSAVPEGNNTIPINKLTFGGFAWNTGTGVPKEPGVITIDTTGVISPTTLYVMSTFTAGVNTVTATDALNVIATGTFTITTPTIAISPTTGPAGTTIIITGSGWVTNTVVNNVVTITLKDSSGNPVAFQNVTPDGTGGIAATITVPTAASGGAYTVIAEDQQENTSPAVTFTVPGAAITITPNQGVATTAVQMTGTGFRAYFPMTIKIGGYTLSSQALTDATGTFTYSFTVPGLAPGVQVVLATDGESTATTFFTLTASPVTIGTQLASISTYVVRVWGYSNGTWYLYDPADLAGSDLTTLTHGNGYWINVSADCTMVYGGFSKALTAGWNLIAAP